LRRKKRKRGGRRTTTTPLASGATAAAAGRTACAMGCCVSTSVSAAARRGRPDAAGAAAGNSARSGTSVAGRDHHHNHLVFREGSRWGGASPVRERRCDLVGCTGGGKKSTRSGKELLRAGVEQRLCVRGRNKPLRRRPLLWASEHPMTMSQLRAAREAFWETAPSYERYGKRCGSLASARTWRWRRPSCARRTLWSLPVTSPRGATTSWGTGTRYRYVSSGEFLPVRTARRPFRSAPLFRGRAAGSAPGFFFSAICQGGEPGAIPGAGEDANTIAGTDDEKLGAKGKSRHSSSSSPSVRTNETTAATLAAAEKSAASPAHERSVTVRLSTGTDLKLRVPADEKIAGLRKKVLDALREKEKGEDGEEMGGAPPAAAGGGGGGPGGGGGGAGGERDAGDGKEPAIKFFFLGRMLGDKVRLRELKLPDHGGIVQALVPPP
ncbi:MAG: hypothetical protein BJ554DRAFT_1783, partial [Olpidium bornovanus]